MYWLISKINPYVEKMTNYQNNTSFNQDFDGEDINIKNKKENETNLLSNSFQYFSKYDDKSPLKEINRGSSTINLDKMLTEQKTILELDEVNRQTFDQSQSEEQKRKWFKKVSKVFDIISLTFIIVSFCFAVLETNWLYNINKIYILSGQIILNQLYNDGYISWSSVFEKYNLTEMLYGRGYDSKLDGKVLISGYYNEFIKDNTNASFNEIDNIALLMGFNITEKTYNYYEDSTIYDIIVPIKIDYNINRIRWGILIVTLISMISSFSAYYFCYLFKKVFHYNQIPFYKTELFFYSLFEFCVLIFLPYPSLGGVSSSCSHEECTIYPVSVFFSIIVYLRVFYLLKFIKFSYWNSSEMIHKCNTFGIKHTLGFAIKCFFSYHPKKMIFLVFIIICFSFGMSIRTMEMYYWAGISFNRQYWENVYNALWCIFLTILSSSSTDIYPKTNIGKILIVIVTLVGIVLLCNFMTYLSALSSFNFREEQMYSLITRIEIRTERMNLYSHMIYNYLSYFTKKNKQTCKIVLYRTISDDIKKLKELSKKAKFFDFVPTKELCIDIIEAFESDIKRLNTSISILKILNQKLNKFIEKQSFNIKKLQQNVISIKKLYILIENCGETFGNLANYDRKILIQELGNNYYSIKKAIHAYTEKVNNDEIIGRRKTNPNQFFNFNFDRTYIDEFLKNNSYSELFRCKNDIKDYNVSAEEFNEHFANLFFDGNYDFFFYDKGKLKWNSSKTFIYPKKQYMTQK